MDVFIRLLCVRVVLCLDRDICDGLIPRPRSPTDCVCKIKKLKKAVEIQQWALEPLIIIIIVIDWFQNKVLYTEVSMWVHERLRKTPWP
jgi:hypothetical protein